MAPSFLWLVRPTVFLKYGLQFIQRFSSDSCSMPATTISLFPLDFSEKQYQNMHQLSETSEAYANKHCSVYSITRRHCISNFLSHPTVPLLSNSECHWGHTTTWENEPAAQQCVVVARGWSWCAWGPTCEPHPVLSSFLFFVLSRSWTHLETFDFYWLRQARVNLVRKEVRLIWNW